MSVLVAPPTHRAVRRDPTRLLPPVLVDHGRLVAVWGALFLNVLAFSDDLLLLPIPRPLGQAITQASLGVAVLLVLTANRRLLVRPHPVLVLFLLLAVIALCMAPHNAFASGSAFRAVRLLAFVSVLWLLTPWFGRADMVLLRCHRVVLWAVLGSVLLGVLVSPGTAFSFDGRLSGVIWPIPPTQVGHYAAIVLGTTLLLWIARVLGTTHALVAMTVSGGLLVATHTRTAVLAVLVATAVGVLSLFLRSVRARRTTIAGLLVAALASTVLAPALLTWARRGQSAAETTDLTGRTKVWSQVASTPRPLLNDVLGNGLSNRSFNGLPIDSNWVATYVDQGFLGIAVEIVVLLLLLAAAASCTRPAHRSVALFLVVYCMVASITETGLGDASPYLLDLTVAAALVARERRSLGSRPVANRGRRRAVPGRERVAA